jgi:type I restriction-modification system DNA methylase subunit
LYTEVVRRLRLGKERKSLSMTDKITQQQINNAVWTACDTFRGVIDSGSYKDYILVTLFLKYIKLERTISGFFDYIENVIESETQLTMQDMAESVDKFLTFDNHKILGDKGCVSKASADKNKKGLGEYKVFNKIQKN